MNKISILLLAALVGLVVPSRSYATDEQDQVRQAAEIMQHFRSMPEKQIPRDIVRNAKGLAILRVVKGGFIWSGKFGEGVVIARTGRGWSGPAFIRTAGVGFGAQIGGQVSDIVLVLNTSAAVRAFAEGGNVQLGGELSIAAGPVGREASASVANESAVYSYSLSKGLFAGVSLEGAVVTPRHEANARYYHGNVTPAAILRGSVTPPPGSGQIVVTR